jgi:hypothetical protein
MNNLDLSSFPILLELQLAGRRLLNYQEVTTPKPIIICGKPTWAYLDGGSYRAGLFRACAEEAVMF